MSLTVTSVEERPGVFIVRPVGFLDSNTYSVLEQKMDLLTSQGSTRVITIDMSDLQYISSMGIRVILKTKRDLSRKGGVLCMVSLQPQIKKVFEIINALPSLKVFASLREMDDYLAEMQRRTLEGE